VRSGLPYVASVAAAGLLGGGVAFAVGSAMWDDEGGTTTVVEAADAATEPPSFAGSTGEQDGGSIGDVYRRVSPGVIQVTSNVVTESVFGPQRQQGLGSGFVVDKDGHIVTNYHVIQGASEVFVNFSQDDQLKAKVVGADPATDIALLKIDGHRRGLAPISLGDSDKVKVGDEVVAIGNPFGLERSVTSGIVSALQREIVSPNNFPIDQVIQTDAAINRGNSGGPLLNAEGQVIGVNTQIATAGSEGNVGIGFAVPVNTVRDVVMELMRTGRVEHPYLGISMQDVTDDIAGLIDLPPEGVLVARVIPDSPADDAGIRGGDTSVVIEGESYIVGGDVITHADGLPVSSSDDVRRALRAKKPGQTLPLQIRRGDQTLSVTVTLGQAPTEGVQAP
jgi:S1-C subfamily serine protease